MQDVLSAILRYGVAALFIAGGLAKIRFADEFGLMVRAYGIVWRPGPVRAAATGVTASEIVIGAGLLAQPVSWYSAVAAIATLAIFSGAAAVALLKGRRPADCGCMPGARRTPPVGWHLFLRNGALACLLVPTVRPAVTAVAILCAVLCTAVALALDDGR